MAATLRKSLGFILILSFLIWMVQSLRLVRFVAYQGAPLADVAVLLFGTFPRILGVVLPIGLCCGTVSMFLRLRHDRQDVAAGSFGCSPWSFAWPNVVLAIIFSGLAYGLALCVNPKLTRLTQNKKHAIRHMIDPGFLTPGVFFQLGKRTLYLHSQQESARFGGVFLHDQSQQDQDLFLMGQRGHLGRNGSGFVVVIENGACHIFKKGQAPIMTRFERYSVDITAPPQPIRSPHIQEQSLRELNQALTATRPQDTKAQGRLKQEVTQRLVTPLLSILDILWITLCMGFFASMPAVIGLSLMGVSLLHAGALVLPSSHLFVIAVGVTLVIAWSLRMGQALWRLRRIRSALSCLHGPDRDPSCPLPRLSS
jgi:lipopolysaccharide export system permease protein